MYITRPDGTTPLFGDDDGGRLLLSTTTRLTTFAQHFRRSCRFRTSGLQVCGGGPREETLWLVGQKVLLRSTTLPPKNLRSNPTRSTPVVIM